MRRSQRPFLMVVAVLLACRASMAADCPLAEKFERSARSFLALDFKNERERTKGEEASSATIDSRDASESLEKFDRMPRKDRCRLVTWKAFVDMSRAHAPFDGESGAAGIIAELLLKHPELVAPTMNR